jgi:hypothetical protein
VAEALARLVLDSWLAGLGRRRGEVVAVIARTPALATLLFAVAASCASILARWPYQFTGPGSPDQVPEDSLFLGTLLGPPFALLILFGVAVLLAIREGRSGFVATVALIPLLLTMAGGSLGEAFSPLSADVPHPVQLWGGFLSAVVYLGLLAAVVGALRGHQRAGEAG